MLKRDGNTVLHFACCVGNVLLIRRLLRHDEDINAKSKTMNERFESSARCLS